jgi:hypothetical protein
MNGFAAGTPVHTADGLEPIESLRPGDRVLSQPAATGERAHRKVARIVRHEDRAIFRAYFRAQRTDGEFDHQELLVTGDHPIYVAGHHNNGTFSKEYWEQLDNRVGWRAVHRFESHQLVQLAAGTHMHAGFVHRIWRTRVPGEGWIHVHPESVMGHRLQIADGKAIEAKAQSKADFAGVEDFNIRYETPETEDYWSYKCAVYDLEVEDFGTYYAGEHGVWVRSGQ